VSQDRSRIRTTRRPQIDLSPVLARSESAHAIGAARSSSERRPSSSATGVVGPHLARASWTTLWRTGGPRRVPWPSGRLQCVSDGGGAGPSVLGEDRPDWNARGPSPVDRLLVQALKLHSYATWLLEAGADIR
jgi:hypothetical protein